MNTKNLASPPANRTFLKALLVCGVVTLVLIGLMLGQETWGGAVQILCGFYALSTCLFFLAQIYGFVVSQTHYSESVEAPKFLMLEREEEEWRK